MELDEELRNLRHSCYVQQQEIEEYKRQLWKRAEDYNQNALTQPLSSDDNN